MLTPETQKSVIDKKGRRGSGALSPEARKQAMMDLEHSFKGREWSSVLTEVLGRKDLEVQTYKYDEISVGKEFPITVEEAIEDVLNGIVLNKNQIQEYEEPGPHSRKSYRHGTWVDEEMTETQVQKEIQRLRNAVESSYERIERIKQGKEKLEPKTFTVARFPTKEVLGERDAEAYKALDRKSRAIKERFSRLSAKFQEISWKREEEIQRGFLGIGKFSQLVNKTKLDHYLGLLENVSKRLEKEPLLDADRFIQAHILAAAGKRHDRALVEEFDPQQIEDVYQQYVKKCEEYEEALKPFEDKEKTKSGGPYR